MARTDCFEATGREGALTVSFTFVQPLSCEADKPDTGQDPGSIPHDPDTVQHGAVPDCVGRAITLETCLS